jgi:hypothetical protein
MPPPSPIGDPSARYRRDGSRTWIELRLRTTRQLFDARDPAPFRERDLDDEAVEYLVSATEEIPTREELALHLSFSEEPAPHALDADTVAAAIRQHFAYEVARARRQLRANARVAQVGIVAAAVLLGLCVAVAGALETQGDAFTWRMIREGIVILGWVALWRPLESLLHDWWPLVAHIRVLRRIASAHVEVRFEP